MNNIDKNDIILYTIEDIQNIFKLGRTKAYELMSSDGFPSFKLNSRIYIEKDKLHEWINKRAGKEYHF